MKNILRNILILIILVIIFIILNFYKSKKNIFDDITILGLWDDVGFENENEYELTSENTVEIDVFTTINNKIYKKIAPGSKGSIIIKFKRPQNLNYTINVIEKTSKPQNLVFYIENKKYTTLEDMEYIINQKFKNTEKITINWEWKYYIDEKHDMQDTNDGQKADKFLFEISAIVEDQERTEI